MLHGLQADLSILKRSAQDSCVNLLMLLTDGLPTVEVRDPREIIEHV